MYVIFMHTDNFLIFHIKNRLIRWRVVIPAAVAGSFAAVAAAFFATAIDTGLLRKLFGGFLIFVGLWELLKAPKGNQKGS